MASLTSSTFYQVTNVKLVYLADIAGGNAKPWLLDIEDCKYTPT